MCAIIAAPDCQTCGFACTAANTEIGHPDPGRSRRSIAKTRHVGNHRLGIGVWLVGLVPYVCGMRMGIPALRLDSNVAFASAIGTFVVAGLLIFGAEAKRLRR